MALFLALGGAGYAATSIGGGVKVTCTASHGHKHVSCAVVRGPSRGPRGPRGPQGSPGLQGPSGGSGPTTFTQAPAYIVDPNNSVNFLTAITAAVPNSYLEEQDTVAEDANATTDLHNDLLMPLESPSQIGGSATHLASVQFCLNISPNTDTNFHGQSSVSVDAATVYQLNEANPNGAAGSGDLSGPPPYTKAVLLHQTYTGQTQIDSCLTASSATPAAINPNGYLVLAITLGLTTTGGTPFSTNKIQLGRVTTTYSP